MTQFSGLSLIDQCFLWNVDNTLQCLKLEIKSQKKTE